MNTIDENIDNLDEVYGIIYLYESPSGGIYVGQTIYSINDRKKQHIEDVNRGSRFIFHNAMRKYGIDKFTSNIIAVAYSKKELNDLEIYYINYYNSYYKNDDGTSNKKGYNMTHGGEGCNGYIFTEEDKAKLSQSLQKYYSNPDNKKKNADRQREYIKRHPEASERHSRFMKEYANRLENKEKTRKIFEEYRKKNPNAISEQQTEIWQRDGYKEKMSNKHKEVYNNLSQEEKDKRLDNLGNGDHTEHYKILKESKNTEEEKEKFAQLMKNDRLLYPEKYDKAQLKRKETMNTREFKENMSKTKRKYLKSFEVFKDGKLIGDFNNTIDCIEKLGFSKKNPPSIVKCLNGDLTKSHGYEFKYK
tara:strand:+ start:166 stop:1248 length:1083 start_codon:yes stop_codon:yes gene_type:complete